MRTIKKHKMVIKSVIFSNWFPNLQVATILQKQLPKSKVMFQYAKFDSLEFICNWLVVL